jgi:hypothetical protein
MGNICNKLYSLLRCSKNSNNLDEDYVNATNATNRKKNVPPLTISNAISNLNNTEDEPPSYREVREGNANFYKKTMLFNGFSDTLIARPRM